MKYFLITLALSFPFLTLAHNYKRLEIKTISDNIYEARQLIGLDHREGKSCGLFDVFWCPKFLPTDNVYVTELHFTNKTRFILNLTADENEALQNAISSRANPAINLSGCAKDGLPYSLTCKYEDIKFVK